MSNSATTKRFAVAGMALAALLALAAWLLAGPLAAKDRNSTVLGVTAKTPKPLCPANCEVTGTVTGFGVKAEGKKGLFRVPANGHIVAWSVDLGKPSKEDQEFFGGLLEDKRFGKEAVAQLAVLKKSKEKGSFYRLSKSSPPVPLAASFGRKPIFTLRKPLKVKKGTVAALTLPTWAPLYTNRVSAAANSFKASRDSGKCSGDQDVVIAAKPHTKKGSTREYGCEFAGERLLYWAYFVPAKKNGGGKGGGDRILNRSAAPGSGGIVPVG